MRKRGKCSNDLGLSTCQRILPARGGGGWIVRTELEGPRVRQSALMRGLSRGEGLGQLVTTLPPYLPAPSASDSTGEAGQQRGDRSRHACERGCSTRERESRRGVYVCTPRCVDYASLKGSPRTMSARVASQRRKFSNRAKYTGGTFRFAPYTR